MLISLTVVVSSEVRGSGVLWRWFALMLKRGSIGAERASRGVDTFFENGWKIDGSEFGSVAAVVAHGFINRRTALSKA